MQPFQRVLISYRSFIRWILFVIGAGSGPMHSLVGILQGAKDTLADLGELAALGPLKQDIKDLQDKIS